jgi:hypothetical protein
VFQKWYGWLARIAQGLKPLGFPGFFGTTKQAAEKWRSGSEFPEKLPSGAKALR